LNEDKDSYNTIAINILLDNFTDVEHAVDRILEKDTGKWEMRLSYSSCFNFFNNRSKTFMSCLFAIACPLFMFITILRIFA